MRLTAPDGYRAQRSYSIASTPGNAAFIVGIITAMTMPVRQVLICGSNPFGEAAAEAMIAAGMDATGGRAVTSWIAGVSGSP